MKRTSAFLFALVLSLVFLPRNGFSAANDYLPDSSAYTLDWKFTETPPQRLNPKILNSANYEAKWKINNSLLFSLVQDQNGILYTSDADDYVHAVYPNGKEKWSLRLDMGFKNSVIYLKLGRDGTIYAYSTDTLTSGSTSLFALSPEGKVKWRLPPSMIYSRFDYQFAGDPQGNFVYFTAEGLTSRNSEGEINWVNTDISTADPADPDGYLKDLHRSKVFIDPEGNIYVDSPDREIISLDSEGRVRWTSETQSYLNAYSSFQPYFSKAGHLYMLTIDGLHALNASDGSAVAITSQIDLSDIRSSGVPTDGHGGYYIEYQGSVKKIDSGGSVKWSYILRTTEKYGVGYLDSLPTDEAGNVYFSTGVGNIIGLNSEGKEIFVFLRNAYWYKTSEIAIGSNGNLYSTHNDIGLVSFGKKQIQVYLDNLALPLSVAPIQDSGSVLVPFRSLFESLGLEVGWNPDTQTITGTKEGLSIQLRISSKTAYVNGQAKTLAAAPKIANNSTFVPLRFIGEAIGKNVSWDAKRSSVNIDSKG